MSPLSATALFAGVVAVVVSPGCSSKASPVGLAAGCSLNSDCDTPLVCVFGKCHEACRVSTDCAQPEVCVAVGTDSVCTLPGETNCPDGGGCPGQLTCGHDLICHNACESGGPCPVPGQTCVDGACVDMPTPSQDAGGDTTTGGDSSADSSPTDSTTPPADASDSAVVPPADAGPLGFVASNLPPSAVAATPADGGVVVVSASCTAGAQGCALAAPMTISQNDGSPADLYLVTSFTLDTTATLTFMGGNPVIIASLGDVQIRGEISVAANQNSAVAGGFAPQQGSNLGPGAGQGGVGAYINSAGGGAAYCGAGGKGFALMGSSAPGGAPYGNAKIEPLLGGSAGGSQGNGFSGGGGGGAIQIVSATSITVGAQGVVHAGGGGSGGGNSAGGGSGGAILLEAPQVTIAGTLAANGGGGGGSLLGANANPNTMPASGGLDQFSVAIGGQGSAGTTLNGADGTGDATNHQVGAGGGGAGWIRINTTGKSATISGTISPAATTTCFSQGTLGG